MTAYLTMIIHHRDRLVGCWLFRIDSETGTFDGFTVPCGGGAAYAICDSPIFVADLDETLGSFSCGPCSPDNIRAAARDWVLEGCTNNNGLSGDGGKPVNVGSQL